MQSDSLKWEIGDVSIHQIVEMEGGELIQESIPEATPENIKKIPWLIPSFADEDGKLHALVQSFLIQSHGKNILVDTCNGNGKNRPISPSWGNLNTNFLEKLRNTGVDEAHIDMVICTHLHFDHVGWNTYLKDGNWIPTFPNAVYLFSKIDFEYWQHPGDQEVDDDKFAIVDSVSPIVKSGLSQLVDSNFIVDENVKLISTPGHTPGHVSLIIESQGEKAIISGDFIHHPCQFAHPEWNMLANSLSDVAEETRKSMLEELAGAETLLIGTHFSNPVAGYVKKSSTGYVFEV